VHACDELRGGCVAASVGTTAGARVCVTRGAARQRRAPHLPVAHAAALGQHELLGEPVKHVRERQEAEVRVVVVQALVVRLEVRVAPRDGRHEARVRDHHALGVACHERWHVRVVVVVVCVCVGGGGGRGCACVVVPLLPLRLLLHGPHWHTDTRTCGA
jgi:hypothetical protein